MTGLLVAGAVFLGVAVGYVGGVYVVVRALLDRVAELDAEQRELDLAWADLEEERERLHEQWNAKPQEAVVA